MLGVDTQQHYIYKGSLSSGLVSLSQKAEAEPTYQDQM